MAKSAKKPRLGRGLSSLMAPTGPQQSSNKEGEGVQAVVESAPASGGVVEPKPIGEAPAADGVVAPEGAGAPGAGGSTTPTPESAPSAPNSVEGMLQVAIDAIAPNPFQPRSPISAEDLSPLADSIAQSGILQPILVRRSPDVGGEMRYELVAGERRWRAARLAGLSRVPVIVRTFTDQESAELAIVENVQREDLNPIDRAKAFAELATRFGLSHAQIAERVGLNRSSITNVIRLAELEPSIQAMIVSNDLTMGHGKALLSIADPAQRLALAQETVRDGLSVREVERRAQRIPVPATAPRPPQTSGKPQRPAAVAELERSLADHLGTRVVLKTDKGGKRGEIRVAFYDLDHFDDLMRKFGFQSAP